MKKLGILFLMLLTLTVFMVACKEDKKENEQMSESTSKNKKEYEMITMKDAKSIFEEEGDYIIVDVRRVDEYSSGHIPNAINIPNESIGEEDVKQLPDKEQTIYIYCRSGNRSKQAAEKLVKLGYSNIIEFGGILDWEGEVICEN